MKKVFFFFSLFLISTSSDLYALKALDPIAWTLLPASGFPAQTNQGSTYVVRYTLTNNLPFSVPLTVSYHRINGGSFIVTNNCNKTLAPKNQPGSTCQVNIKLHPVKTGNHDIGLRLAYHNNRVPLPLLTTTSISKETSDKINGHVTTPLPAVSYIGNSYPVQFTFVNNGSGTVTASAVNVSGFTPTTNTCTTALTPNSTCIVAGTFTPAVVGFTTLNVTYIYNGISVPLTTQSDVQNGSGPCHHIEATVALPLPISSFRYANNVVKYEFTNLCPATTESLGTISYSSDASGTTPTILTGTDTCSNTTLAPNATCSAYISVIPNAISDDLSITAALPYNNNGAIAQATTSENVSASQTTTHTIYFVNQCDENVWYEFQNGAGGTGPTRKSPDPTPPPATFANYQLNRQLHGAAPSTITLNVNEYLNGAIYGRTGCNTSTGICTTANCDVIPGTGMCQGGNTPTAPVTIFELNLNGATNPNGSFAPDGVYDVSIINGFNIPGEVRSMSAPISPFNFTTACGQSAGAVIQTPNTGLGVCPWSFSPPTQLAPDSLANFYWVSAGADDGCTSQTCPSVDGVPQYCGTAFASAPHDSPINRRCGTFQGYWTLTAISGYPSSLQWGSINLYNAYGMGNPLPSYYGPGALFSNLFACVPINGNLLSGYSSTQNVCGCYDWNKSDSVAPTAQEFNCIAQNMDWINDSFPRLAWLKQACPTAYVYQWDDASTSFTCNVANQRTPYQIVYCPAGKTGKPGT